MPPSSPLPAPHPVAERGDASASPRLTIRLWVVGCGLLGSRLLARAQGLGMQVLGIDPAPAACAAPAVGELPVLVGDASSPALLAAARARLDPEVIFCCAATHGGDEAAYRAVYVELPRALQAACPSARLVFCSSSSVYALLPSARVGILQEAEGFVLAHGGVVARLVPLYGGGRCELLRAFVCREPELPGEDSRWLNYVHADDAARALLLLAGQGAAGCVYDVCGESFRRGAVYEALSALTGLPRVAARREAGRRGMSSRRVSAELLAACGWQPEVVFLEWAATHWQRML